MRKITQNAINAFYNGVLFSSGNTVVTVTGDCTNLYLHGNKIAMIQQGLLFISDAGWPTATTKDRLNGLKGVSVNTVKGVLHLNGKPWNGEWVEVVA